MRRPLLVTITAVTLLVPSGSVVSVSGNEDRVASGAFEPAGSLTLPRGDHKATRLADGRVLVIGGEGDGEYRYTAEVWDPMTAEFTPAGSLSFARSDYRAELLPDGRVIVADCCSPAEVWDPATDSFVPPGPLADVRTGNPVTEFSLLRRTWHTGTLLRDGRVLIIGGSNPTTFEFPAEAQVIDASAIALEPAGTLEQARAFHTATLLPDGRVLVIGGSGPDADGHAAKIGSAEVWDPETSSFSPAGPLAEPRDFHTATLLPDGRVLVIGGEGTDGVVHAAEIWDPDTSSFSPAGSLTETRTRHTATPLADGSVLVVGGCCPREAAEVWSPTRE